ncbi:hypothetical protein GFL21_08175 [Rhizobium anhuiense]|nr:hypothetical protein [Rhizobium anhuiense]
MGIIGATGAMEGDGGQDFCGGERRLGRYGRGIRLPLTLTLSPLAGRGDVPNAAARLRMPVRHISLLPASGEKVPAGG